MIVLAVLLWVQVVFLALLTGAAIYQGGKDSRYSVATVSITGFVFGVSMGTSLIAALVIGGLA